MFAIRFTIASSLVCLGRISVSNAHTTLGISPAQLFLGAIGKNKFCLADSFPSSLLSRYVLFYNRICMDIQKVLYIYINKSFLMI